MKFKNEMAKQLGFMLFWISISIFVIYAIVSYGQSKIEYIPLALSIIGIIIAILIFKRGQKKKYVGFFEMLLDIAFYNLFMH